MTEAQAAALRAWDEASLELLISGQVFVAESYDRKVDIALRLLSLDAEIATQTLRNLKAEEGRATAS